jgi:hypothetical protein
MEQGSPFGPGIQALVIHLHVTQAISFERQGEMMKATFGLELSEGAIANILQRAPKPMLAAAVAIAEEARRAEVLASDETSARVTGRKTGSGWCIEQRQSTTSSPTYVPPGFWSTSLQAPDPRYGWPTATK